MKMTLTRAAIATSTFVCAALFSISWTEQGSLSLSVSKADARARVYITSGYAARAVYSANPSWYAVRAYYNDGPGAAMATATMAGLTTRRAAALAARPVPRSKAGTASCTSASRTNH